MFFGCFPRTQRPLFYPKPQTCCGHLPSAGEKAGNLSTSRPLGPWGFELAAWAAHLPRRFFCQASAASLGLFIFSSLLPPWPVSYSFACLAAAAQAEIRHVGGCLAIGILLQLGIAKLCLKCRGTSSRGYEARKEARSWDCLLPGREVCGLFSLSPQFATTSATATATVCLPRVISIVVSHLEDRQEDD